MLQAVEVVVLRTGHDVLCAASGLLRPGPDVLRSGRIVRRIVQRPRKRRRATPRTGREAL